MEGIKEIKEELEKIDVDVLRKIDEEKLLKINKDSKISELSEIFETGLKDKEFSSLFDATKHIVYGLVKISKMIKEE